MKLNEMREERAKVIKAARDLLETAEKEKRDLTDEENGKYSELMNKQTDLRSKIDREEQLIEAERQLDMQHVPGEPVNPQDHRGMDNVPQETRISNALNAYFRGGQQALALHPEHARALQVTPDSSGGYLVMPEMFVNSLIKFVDDQVYMRQWGTVYSVPDSNSLGVPSLENDPADSNWTTELGTGSEDSTMSFGKRSLTPHPLAKRIKISDTLLRKVASAENLVRDRLGYKMAITQEKAFLTGSGASQPLGVFTADNNGIGTGRDVSTGNTTTSVTIDGLKEAKYTLKGQYWPSARWLGHRDLIKMVSKLKDGEGQYIWQEGAQAGEPDRLLGIPYAMSEFAPNTYTTGLYCAVLGSFQNYWIADSLGMRIQRLVELYAETNQVGLISRSETDGMPVLAEAFVRVTLA